MGLTGTLLDGKWCDVAAELHAETVGELISSIDILRRRHREVPGPGLPPIVLALPTPILGKDIISGNYFILRTDTNGQIVPGDFYGNPTTVDFKQNRATAGTPTVTSASSGALKRWRGWISAGVACAAAAQPAVGLTLTDSVAGVLWQGSLAAPVNDTGQIQPLFFTGGVNATWTLNFDGACAAGVIAWVALHLASFPFPP